MPSRRSVSSHTDSGMRVRRWCVNRVIAKCSSQAWVIVLAIIPALKCNVQCCFTLSSVRIVCAPPAYSVVIQ